jgi:RHS repeat-associated protein
MIRIHFLTTLGFKAIGLQLYVSFLLILCGTSAAAQNTTSPTDISTPAGMARGTPAGSYELSGFDHVNLYNGNLDFHLPLLGIGGRGGAKTAIILSLNSKGWKDDHYDDGFSVYDIPDPNWWQGLIPGYGPGVLEGRQSGLSTRQCSNHQSPPTYITEYVNTTTTLTFTEPDGTEHELRDQLYNGQPLSETCSVPNYTGQARGHVFVSTDGSSMTFISDATISDYLQVFDGPRRITPSGYLLGADGSRYRIDNGLVSWIRDRNGNQIRYAYDNNARVNSITDSLNRKVTINYDVADVSPYGTCDQIIYKGFGGAQRIIRVSKAHLGDAGVLRNTEPGDVTIPQTYGALFPELGSYSGIYNPTVVSGIWLPSVSGGPQLHYQLSYNPYGELTRVVPPTGGATEYDMNPGSGVTSQAIIRRLAERRTYPQGGAGNTYESRSIYTVTQQSSSSDPYPWTSTVREDHVDSSGTLMARENHYFKGSAFASMIQATGPAGRSQIYSRWYEGREYQTEATNTNGTTVLRRTVTTFQQRVPVSWWASWVSTHPTLDPSGEPSNDPRTTQVDTTLVDTNQVTRQTLSYDPNTPYNSQTDVYEYDYGSGAPGALLRRTHTDYLKTNSVNGVVYDTVNPNSSNPDLSATVHIRNAPFQQQVFDAGGIARARTTYEYDNYAGDANHAGLADRLSISGLDASFTTSYTTRGNVTGTTSYLLVNGTVTGSISAYSQYDVAGNLVKAIDARGNATNLGYSDCFGAPNGNARLNSAPLELSSVGQASYALPSSVTNAMGQTSFSQFDYYTGRPVDREDPNGIVASGYSENDSLDRPTKIIRAVNTAAQNQTVFAYDDIGRTITTSSDLNTNFDGALVSMTLYDGLGRTTETRQYEGGTNYIATQQQYDALGRAFKTSNPFRPWQSETAIWTTSAFDALGRVISVTTPDSAIVTSSYSGTTVTVTDQNGKARKSVSDAVGRLKEVYEDPSGLNYLTSYSYDTLDNLTSVSQGTQTRNFIYDSLKRLTSAANPESGTINYQYDSSGNLTLKTDARPVTTTYAYDALNRNTTIDYSDTTGINPDITRIYDGATNGKGRLWESYTGGTATVGSNVEHTKVTGYDVLGRPLSQLQEFKTNGVWSSTYPTQRGYNIAGEVTSQIYPSGRNVVYSYDAAGRTDSFTGNLGDGTQRSYSTEIIYSPLGGMTKEKFGTDTALYNKLFYNSRGQLSEIREGTSYTGPTDTGWERGAIINYYSTCWGMCGGSNSTTPMTDNNGNLKKQEVFVPGANSWLQQYDYDNLNRLQRVHEYTGNTSLDWQQEYVYDRYGNRRIEQDVTKTYGAGINKKDFTANAANDNRLGVPSGQTGAMTYDAAGNLTTDTYSGAAVTRAYDAENRMTSETQANNYLAGSYSYNADGQRVRRTVGGQPSAVTTWQVYGFDGELLAEYAASAAPTSPQKEYGYRNGQLLITAEAPTRTNVALAANGATATAQNYTQDGVNPGLHFQPSYANDGVRYLSPSGDQYWRDEHGLSSWLQIDFNGARTIDEIDVGTVRDDYATQGDPATTQTFTAYGATSFEVQYLNGSTWTTVPGGAITGNNQVWRKVSFSALTTSAIRVRINAAVDGVARLDEVEAWGATGPVPPAKNVALASNGGVASAQNYTADYSGLHFQPSYANDGVRYMGPNGDHYWRDEHGLPTWVQVDFSGAKVINEIDVITARDDYATQSDPGATQTFANYGTTAFRVEYWSGSDWVAVPGGSFTGNSLVWRKVSFPAVTTTKLRVTVTATSDGVVRLMEVEAWGYDTANINWLVTDQLGTPRLVFDKTGALATVKRHDYLPFGEELSAGQGARATTLGYGAADGVRQKFTQKERDIETGLDYFLARYYSSAQGRFTSPDEFKGGPEELYTFADDASENPTFYADVTEPQSLNKYQYAYNNPLKYTDPTGHCPPCIEQVLEHPDQVVMEVTETAAAVAAGATAVVTIVKNVNWQKVGDTFYEVFKGSGPGCLAGVDCGPYMNQSMYMKKSNGADKTPADSRPGKDFTPAGKRAIDEKAKNQCESCGRSVKPAQNKKGEPTPADQKQRHHIKPKSQGGSGTPENGKLLCPTCHKEEHRKLPMKNQIPQ